MTNPKILFVASFAESLIHFRLHLIKEFLQRNYTVIVMAPYDVTVANALAQIGVQFIAISLERKSRNPLRDLWLLIELFVFIRREKPDIVFSYTIKPIIYGSIAARLAGVHKIYSMITGTGYIFLKSDFKTRLIGSIAKKMLRLALKFNDTLFFQNKDNVECFFEEGLIRKDQKYDITNGSGVDIKTFTPLPLPTHFSFLMISRLLYTKGVREYVETARILKKTYPDVLFKLAGWIEVNHPLSITQKELSEWITSGDIEYLGMLSDVREAISEASVYVLPSYGEGTPRTVLEAMAMGRPIITTDVAGCRETVVNGVNGFLVAVRDVDALCAAMRQAIHQKGQMLEMGKVSRMIAEEKYDVNKVNATILKKMDIQVFSYHT